MIKAIIIGCLLHSNQKMIYQVVQNIYAQFNRFKISEHSRIHKLGLRSLFEFLNYVKEVDNVFISLTEYNMEQK